MANGTQSDMSFQDFKKLTSEEREYFIFDNICKIGGVSDKLNNMDARYAGKWVETGAKGFAATVLTGVLVAVLALVINK